MNNSTESIDETIEDEVQETGSLNHSIAQTQIAGLLFSDDRFRTMVELSLDASQIDLNQFGLKTKEELKPDVCLYPNTIIFNEVGDILRMSDMPLLTIEVISPKQGLDDIINKFKAYFALQIKSCWLVIPPIKSITVYSQINNFKPYDVKHDPEVIDEVLDIRLPLEKIFR